MTALRFRSPERERLRELNADDSNRALKFCDRSHLSLPLALTAREDLPEPMRERLDCDLDKNAERWRRAQIAYREIASAFESEGLEFLVLKGFSHCPQFARDPRWRTQSDFDLLLPREHLLDAQRIAMNLLYEPIVPHDRHPIDHLPTMIRKTGWQWRGDFFDPEMPLSLELHFRLWDEPTERFGPGSLDELWNRRVSREVDCVRFTGLHCVDALGYACLHALRHLLRGDMRPYHFYELANCLQDRVDDAEFWDSWNDLHGPDFRRLQAICFSLAQRWFDCKLPDAAACEIEALPAPVHRWMAEYAWTPVAGLFRPNKDELWLHWSLMDSRSARFAVLRRRLLPTRVPHAADDVHVPHERQTWQIVARRYSNFLKFGASRLLHHGQALFPTIGSAVRWFGAGLELRTDYWRLFLAEGCFDFGMFVFFFLYNLYLLKIGFNEQFIGLIASISTVGNIAGSLFAVFAIRRYGLRRALIVSFALVAVISALRALITSAPALLGLAALSGLVFSVWPVALAPTVTAVTTEKSRARGFSFICSSGIAIGIFGSAVAGKLPGWISALPFRVSIAMSYRVSLIMGSAIVLLALLPLWRANLNVPEPAPERKFRRPSPVVIRFLIAMLVWNLGTGLFNPFRNVFFAKTIHMAVGAIGYVFSWSQAVQVVAVLLAPLIFRKYGITRGIASMELATAVLLFALAISTGPVAASVTYCGFMAAQYMSEPGMFTLLMDGAAAQERNSASALNFLVSFAGQAVAAGVGGALLARFGYPPVLTSAAIMCALAAFLFALLLKKQGSGSP